MNRCAMFLLLLFGLGAAAQQPAPENQTTREDVLQLFEAMQVKSQAEQMLQTMNEQIGVMMQQQMEKIAGGLPPEFKTEMDNMLKEMTAAYPVQQVIEDMIPVYQKHLDKRHIQAIASFYQSEAGKHLLSTMPEIMREAMPASMARAQERMDPIVERYQRRMAEIIERHSREHGPNAKPAPAKPAPKKPASQPK